MKTKFFRTCVILIASAVLSAGVAEASFWGRLFGKEKKEETVEAAAGQSGGAASAGQNAEAATGMKLDAQTALATAASVKSALSSIAANGPQLRALLAERPELQGLLDKAIEAAKKGDDLLALDQIQAIGEAAQLTDAQSKLVGELKKDFEVLALGRNFPEDGPVSSAIAQIKSGEYGKAVGTLGEMAKDGSLTDKQRSVLNTVIQQYAGDLKRFLPF